jgi:hypothetical protein
MYRVTLNELSIRVKNRREVIRERDVQHLQFFNHIDEIENIQEIKQQQRNNEKLIQLEQWEHIAFLTQQMK